jgi:hypothetical protein
MENFGVILVRMEYYLSEMFFFESMNFVYNLFLHTIFPSYFCHMTLVEFSTFVSVFVVLSEIALVLGWWLYIFSTRYRKWSLHMLSERWWMIAALSTSAVSMAGSLMYSHIYELPVCMLCYYQRLCMYPLVLFLRFFRLHDSLLFPSVRYTNRIPKFPVRSFMASLIIVEN